VENRLPFSNVGIERIGQIIQPAGVKKVRKAKSFDPEFEVVAVMSFVFEYGGHMYQQC
jgi:hypothetical protein